MAVAHHAVGVVTNPCTVAFDLNLEAVGFAIAQQVSGGGRGKMCTDDEGWAIGELLEHAMPGGDGHRRIVISAAGQLGVPELDGMVQKVACDQGLFALRLDQHRTMSGAVARAGHEAHTCAHLCGAFDGSGQPGLKYR